MTAVPRMSALSALVMVLLFGGRDPISAKPPTLVVAATVSVATIPATPVGNSFTATVTVNNTGTVSSSFGVGAEVRQGSTVVATLPSQFTSSIAAGSSTTKQFTYILPCSWTSGSYVFRAAAWTGTPGSSTWLNSFDRTFTVQAAVVAASITVGTIPSTVSGSSISATCPLTNAGTCPRTFGVGAEIRQGSTLLATLPSQTTATIQAGSTANPLFQYVIPSSWTPGTYTFRAVAWSSTPGASTWLDSYDRTFNLIGGSITVATIPATAAGSNVTANYTATNLGNVSWTFGIGAEIRQGSNVLATLVNQMISISSGNSYAGSYQFTLPCNWAPGNYTFRAAIWSGTPGSSTWLNSFDRTFSIQSAPASAGIVVGVIPSVMQGGLITPSCPVTNTGTCPRTFGVAAEIRQGAAILATLPSQTTGTIQPASSSTAFFQYTIPAGWASGTYVFRAVVWSSTPGSSTWLGSYDQPFSVTQGLPTITATGLVRSILTPGSFGAINQALVEVRQGGVLKASTVTSSSGAYSVSLPAGSSAGMYTVRAILGSIPNHPAVINYRFPGSQQSLPVSNPATDLTYLAGGTATGIDIHVPHPIVFVHGILSSASAWSTFKTELQSDPASAWSQYPRRGYACGAVDYNYLLGHATNAATMHQDIAQFRSDLSVHFQGVVPIDIIAHSMGGLVTRAYLDLYAQPGEVDRVFTLATPHSGALGASGQALNGAAPPSVQQCDPAFILAVFQQLYQETRGARFILVGASDNLSPLPEIFFSPIYYPFLPMTDDGLISTLESVWYPTTYLTNLNIVAAHLVPYGHTALNSDIGVLTSIILPDLESL